jgi:2-oxoisovalerate dehydrogenase E1 component
MKSAIQIPASATLLALYRTMIRIRVVEERIAERYPENRMKCPVHLSIGQEAAAVGMCAHLSNEDIVYSTHRCHAHYLAKGGDMKRMIAEMYGKETGCAHGRGGSMHLIDASCGMYGTSAIVCGSMPLPVGAALSFKIRGALNVSVAFFGDAAIEPGVFHECMNFSVYHKLPVIFFCEDNDYSTMTRRNERQAVPITPRAAGYGMPGIDVDGNDLLKVLAVAGEAVARACSGEGPTLIVAKTYRWREHVEHNTGIMKRPPEELTFWKARDPVARFRKEILSYGVSEHDLEDVEAAAHAEVNEAFRFAEASPEPKISEITRGVGDEVEVFEDPAPPPDGRTLACTEAIAEATEQAMHADPNVFVLGLHVTDPNGIFGTTVPAFNAFGRARVIETPIMEASLTSIAGGAAMMGMRPLHVHARNDFLLLCLSQLGNELTKWRYMSGEQLTVPLVIRAIVGRSRGQGGQHSQSLQSIFAHFPGLHVVAPSNGYDAKGLLLTALTGNAPVIFLEHRLCHPEVCVVPAKMYRIPFGKARIVRRGTDVTIVTLLQSVYEAKRAADILAGEGIHAEVIDLRSIRPWDKETVCASVKKTGRLIVADTGWVDFGISAEIAATVTEREFPSLKAPTARIGLPACPTPMAELLENAYYPGSRDIVLQAYKLLSRTPPAHLTDGFASDAIQGPF